MEQSFKGGEVGKTCSGQYMNEDSGKVECLDQIGRMKNNMEEKRANHVSECTNEAFGMTILRRSV